MERQPRRGFVDVLSVALVDEAEEGPQTLVEVCTAHGLLCDQRHLHQLTQPVKGVPRVILGAAHRQHSEFGGCLGIEQEEDPVEEPQRLHRQRLRLVRLQRLQTAVAAP